MQPKEINADLKKELGADLFSDYLINLDGRHSVYPLDPVEWAAVELAWEARWYQAKFLRDTTSKSVLRWGRRTGKTMVLAVKALEVAIHQVKTYRRDPGTILVVTPYEAQLAKFFEYMRGFLNNTQVNAKVDRYFRDPQSINLSNGSRIIGFTAGEKTGARSDKIRGQDVDYVIVDEADHIRDGDIQAMMAILASHEDCGSTLSATPSGLDTEFKRICEDKRLGYKESWIVSHESPSYSNEVDGHFKRMFSDEQFRHEILACF